MGDTGGLAKPGVQRTYSDPDLPQLLPLPVRPSSSYEARPKVHEYPQFGKDIVDAMAHKLGVDVQTQPDFIWVVRDCLLALRDEGWKCIVHGQGINFQNMRTEDTRTEHPTVELHKKMAERLSMVNNDLKIKRLNPHYRVQQLVYLAIMGEKDVRLVTTPQLIEEVMDNLDVNPLHEPYLIQRIKVTIEDCYFRMKKIGAHSVTIENSMDVPTLIVNLELDRVGFLRKISPSGLLYCAECQTALGDVISTGCHDIFCNACAVEMHSTGNRQDQPLVFFEQSVCSECERQAALVRCQDCVDNFCYDCFKFAHSRGKRKMHCVSLPQRTFCFECDEREASYLCIETGDVLCTRCAARIHRQGARQNHTLFGLRKAAYNKKLFANNLDRLMGIMQNNLERSYSLSPWFIFYDQAVAPYWYNFQTHHQVRADPNDLMNPPLDEGAEPGTAGNNQDEQTLQALPGASILAGTHAAKHASQSAVFDVPPPMHVKYTSPIL
eukprot:gnl/TRDRNA2_/TRDRNA2_179770_c0_seq1.p1 gnl/TRDRNA2_/TRDRNA2_179770_c0~~gnl/TRDRNA2_/TRDRNA2_179770_c0_seq1.p1  ORF type:complete len:494 (+),score=92.98 gnl/TRDRNA2_/TRDRNA2_179770_c0_seq1:115-1596(+)